MVRRERVWSQMCDFRRGSVNVLVEVSFSQVARQFVAFLVVFLLPQISHETVEVIFLFWCKFLRARVKRVRTSPFHKFQNQFVATFADMPLLLAVAKNVEAASFGVIVDVLVPQMVVEVIVDERISERIVEQIVDVLVLQSLEEIFKVVSLLPQKQISERICAQNVEVTVPHVVEQIIEKPESSSQDRILKREVEPGRRLDAGRRLRQSRWTVPYNLGKSPALQALTLLFDAGCKIGRTVCRTRASSYWQSFESFLNRSWKRRANKLGLGICF